MKSRQFKNLYIKEKRFIASLRVYNTRSMILFFLLGEKLSGNLRLNIDFLLIFIIFILTYASASVINFIADEKIDSDNNRYNPLIENDLSSDFIRNILIANAVLCLLISLITTNRILSIFGSLALLILGYIYSAKPFRLSYNPIGKLLSMGLTYTYIPALLGYFFYPPQSITLTALLLICTLYVSWLPFSDFKDVKGDKANGKITLAVLLGERTTAVISFCISLLCTTILFSQLNHFTAKPYLAQLFLVILLFCQLYIIWKPLHTKNKKLQIIGGYLILFTLCILVAF